jgi:hypothetical protein
MEVPLMILEVILEAVVVTVVAQVVIGRETLLCAYLKLRNILKALRRDAFKIFLYYSKPQ